MQAPAAPNDIRVHLCLWFSRLSASPLFVCSEVGKLGGSLYLFGLDQSLTRWLIGVGNLTQTPRIANGLVEEIWLKRKWTTYTQIARPGARAPHVWLSDGRSTLDLFGREFVLLRIGAACADISALIAAATERGLPLTVADVDEPAVSDAYGKSLALVRPDGHVAWRGDVLPDDHLALIDRVRGG